MNFRNVMVVGGALAMVFGIGFLLIPGPLASLYGIELTSSSTFVARLLGVELAGYGILSWLLRNLIEFHVQRLVLLAFFITDATGFVVSVLSQLDGRMNSLGWSIVLIYLLLSLAFGYLYIAGTNAPAAGEAR